jgi:hypothetical protein
MHVFQYNIWIELNWIELNWIEFHKSIKMIIFKCLAKAYGVILLVWDDGIESSAYMYPINIQYSYKECKLIL